MRTNGIKLMWLAAVWTLAGLGSAPQVEGKIVDEIALVVDQDSMTRGELDEAVQALFLAQRMMPPKPGTPLFDKARKDVVEGFIREVLLAEAADQMGVVVSDGEVDKETDHEIENMKKGFPTEKDFNEGLKQEGIDLDDLRQDTRAKLQRRIKANRALRAKQQELPGTVAVTDEEARKQFDQNPADFEQVRFAVILFRLPAGSKPEYVAEVDKQVQQVLSELKGGADFASYAKKYSEEKGSAEKGGLMGTFYRSELDPKLAKGIFAIPEKGLGLVKAPEGRFIVRVDMKKKADYASVAKDIKDSLQKGHQDSGLQKWLDELKKNAHIVLDGKTYVSEPAVTVTSGQDKASPTGSVTDPNSSDKSVKASDAKAGSEPAKGEIYPTLPPGGSFTFSAVAEGFNYGSEDLEKFYPAGVDANQDFPFGYGLGVGLDYSLDPTLQVGLQVEFLRKTTENVTDGSGNKHQWDASVLAPSLMGRVLIPLDEGANFILSAGGGYYWMPDGKLLASGTLGDTKVDLTGFALGGKAGGALEFFLDDQKNSALGFSIDYRYLVFDQIDTKVNQNDLGLTIGSPLKNNNGSKAQMDFSGVNVGVNLRFYLGKD